MRVAIVIFALCVANVAYAADANCTQTMTQTDINLCTYAAASKEQKKLNALLADLKRSLSPQNWKMLEQSQSAWEESRKLDCEIEASFFDGGSIRSAIINSCYDQHTYDRIHRLRYYLCPNYAATGDCKAAAKYK